MKRGQISLSSIVVYMAISLIAIMIFYFGYRAVFGVTQADEKSKLELLKLQQKADVSRISADQKATMSFAYQLPSGYSEFCFVDLTRKDQLNMTYMRAKYPLISNSIESSTNYNAFLIGKDDTVAYNVGSIRVDCEPHFACYNKTGTRLLYRLKGMGVYATPDICAEIPNRPPFFTLTVPANYTHLSLGATQEFKATAIDPEGSNLSIKWTVRSTVFQESPAKTENNVASGYRTNLTYTFDDAAMYYVAAYATDNYGLTGHHEFTVSTTGVILPIFDCYLSSGCGVDTLFVSLSDNTNAHAGIVELPGYTSVCCKAMGAVLSQGCSAAPFYLSATTNAHASLTKSTPNYITPACISSTMGTVNCRSSASGCTSDEKCIVKLSDDTNAHLGTCLQSNYGKSICCRIT